MRNKIEYKTIDKSGWGPGAWQDEPDKIQWIDEATDMDCLIVRAGESPGHLCGYVGVPPGHPWHGKEYDQVDVSVHGGLTFGEACQHSDNPSRYVCHIPEPGRPDGVWWLGFDCGHAWDVSPGTKALPRYRSDSVYRDLAYVKEQVESLAKQVAAAK